MKQSVNGREESSHVRQICHIQPIIVGVLLPTTVCMCVKDPPVLLLVKNCKEHFQSIVTYYIFQRKSKDANQLHAKYLQHNTDDTTVSFQWPKNCPNAKLDVTSDDKPIKYDAGLIRKFLWQQSLFLTVSK